MARKSRSFDGQGMALTFADADKFPSPSVEADAESWRQRPTPLRRAKSTSESIDSRGELMTPKSNRMDDCDVLFVTILEVLLPWLALYKGPDAS